MRVDFRFLIGFAGALAFAGCNSGTGTGGGGPAVTLDQEHEGSYTVVGNTVITTTPGRILWRCEGANLVPVDTQTPSMDTLEFTLQGNTLTVFEPEMEDTLPSGAVVGYGYILTGSGGGGGLQGTWQITDFTYRVVSGVLTTEDLAHIADEKADALAYLASRSLTVLITATDIYTTADENTAQEFLDGSWQWYPLVLPDTSIYDIAVQATGKYTVRLTGGVSGEIVTLTLSPNGDVAYSSSDTSHAAHRHYAEPTVCPNDYEPAWYEPFLDANMTVPGPLPKAAAPQPVRKHRRSIFG